MSFDALKDLLECSFNDIPFPIGSFSGSLSHSLVPHQRVDRDGARIENTGLNFEEFTFHAFLMNGLSRGPLETWDALFPQTFLKLKDSFRSRETGKLIHPVYGEMKVKAVSFVEAFEPDNRGGAQVDLTFHVTRDDDNETAEASPLAIARVAAVDLTAQMGQLSPPPPEATEPPDLEDSVLSIDSAIDQITFVGDQIAAYPDKVIAKCDKIINAVDRLSESPNKVRKGLANSASHAVDSANRLLDAMNRIKREALTPFEATEFFTTQAPTTLGGLAKRLRTTVEDLMRLNPFLVATPIIPSFTVVRYQKAR